MITGGIQRTSRERLYDELGLQSLLKRRWHTKLFLIVIRLLPDYFSSYLDFSTQENYLLTSSSASIIRPFPTRTKSFKTPFFPYCINEWNKVGITNAKSVNIFKKSSINEKKKRKKNRYSLFMIHLV